jgi:tetratricopeptide (TPR) repeat protein
VTMSSRADSMQTGVRLYNEGRFSESLLQFEKIIQSDTGSYDAEKYAGIVCLQLGKYDEAIGWFVKLENNTHLYINYGKFYHALTLLERGQKNDNVLAKQLLQQIVDQGLEGKENAAKWLEKWQP